METEPLTKEEKTWLKKLEKVMKTCPSSRLESFTIGDNDLVFYDKHVFEEFTNNTYGVHGYGKDIGMDVELSGSYLGRVIGKFNILSAAG